MPDQLQVELVSADRLVWSGEATMVIAKTAEGDIGILRNHAPVLSVMVEGAVEIQTEGDTVVAAVDAGFLSVADDRVSILSEHAELGQRDRRRGGPGRAREDQGATGRRGGQGRRPARRGPHRAAGKAS